jgi:hypothetical protein
MPDRPVLRSPGDHRQVTADRSERRGCAPELSPRAITRRGLGPRRAEHHPGWHRPWRPRHRRRLGRTRPVRRTDRRLEHPPDPEHADHAGSACTASGGCATGVNPRPARRVAAGSASGRLGGGRHARARRATGQTRAHRLAAEARQWSQAAKEIKDRGSSRPRRLTRKGRQAHAARDADWAAGQPALAVYNSPSAVIFPRRRSSPEAQAKIDRNEKRFPPLAAAGGWAPGEGPALMPHLGLSTVSAGQPAEAQSI